MLTKDEFSKLDKNKKKDYLKNYLKDKVESFIIATSLLSVPNAKLKSSAIS